MGLSSSASVQRAVYAKRCCVTVVPVSRSFKVIEIDTIRKLAYDFLFAFRSNDMAVTLAVSTHETCVCLISNATERSQKDRHQHWDMDTARRRRRRLYIASRGAKRFIGRKCTFCRFNHPGVVWSHRKGCSLWPVVRKLVSKTRVSGRWKPHYPTVISFGSIPACDGRTDGQIDRPPIAKSRICMQMRDNRTVEIACIYGRQSSVGL